MNTRNKTYNNNSTDEIMYDINNNTTDNSKTNYMKSLYNVFINIIKYAYVVTKIYVIWIILHYSASHLYIYLCAPKTFWGFIVSPFMSVTPQCQALRWVIYNGANMINNMWIVLGTWLSGLLLYTPKLDNPS